MAKIAHRESETVTAEDEAQSPSGYVDDIDFVPTTDLGRTLLGLRRQAIAEGQPLLTRSELEREVAERRGGVIDRDER